MAEACLSGTLAVLLPGVLQTFMGPFDQHPDWEGPVAPSQVFHRSSACPFVARLPFLTSAPCWVKMAEPCTQCWRDTLWPVKSGGEESNVQGQRDLCWNV